jgi:competence protein ComEC
LEDINVVIVPHHGSNTSSSPSFARQLRPRYALVSAGYASRFGHPTEKVVENWQTAGAQVVNTADVGMITLENSRIVADSWQLIGYRERNGRFWNR